MPKVSVIIPTYNRAKYITRALDSVFNQTYLDLEIIVVDDGSIDNTKEILSPYQNRIKYIYQSNSGVSAARNRGIKAALGEYIAFLDSDDVWIAEKLAKQVPVLEKDKEIGIVYSKVTLVNEKNEHCGIKPVNFVGKDFNELIEKGGDLPTSTIVTRRECFDKAGFFDESFSIMEDFEMWLRISRHYKIFQISEPNLALYYCHEEQVTKNKIKVHIATVDLYKKILRIFNDIPKDIIRKRLASNEYVLSRSYYFQSCFSESFIHLDDAIRRDPLVGLSFADIKDNFPEKILKLMKPYLFLIVCTSRLFIKKFLKE